MTDFLSNLNDECAALRAFVVLLEDEQRSLLRQHTDDLLRIADAKMELAGKISDISEVQRSYLANAKLNVAQWIQRNVPQGFSIWKETCQLAAHLQRLNQTNGQLIQIKLRYNQQALNVLYGAVQSTAGLYGANGRPNQLNASRVLGSV